jgi:hypothetical protein
LARVELSEEEYIALLREAGRLGDNRRSVASSSPPKKTQRKRKASAYSKKYGRAFKKVAPKYKKKNGGWKVNGFKAAQRAAHKMAKRMK